MASQEDIQNQNELNDGIRDSISIEQELLEVLNRRAGVSGNILGEQQNISNNLNEQLSVLQNHVTEKRQIRSAVTQINNLARDNYKIGTESLINDKSRTQLSKDIVSVEQQIRFLKQQQNQFRKEGGELEGNIAESLGYQVEDAVKLRNELLGIKEISDKSSGGFANKLFGGLADITKSIPGLKEFSQPFQDASKASQTVSAEMSNAIRTNGKGLTREKIKQLGLESKLGKLSGSAAASKLSAMSKTSKLIIQMKAGFKALAPVIKTILGPLNLILALFKGNSEIVGLKKEMALSNTEAVKFRNNFAEAADESGNVNITATKMLETFTKVNKQFGYITNFAAETYGTMSKLTNVIGLSASSAGNLAAASEINGTNLNDTYKDVLATTYQLQRQSGVQMSNKEILEQTGNVTGQIRANLGSNPVEIAKAVTQAKLFGAELKDVAAAGKTMLDFESSITKELEAELLIGRNLNLEKARAAALAGDQVTLAQELQKEAGSFTEFQSMNVIQQEALASAMGMTSDALADTLMKQEMQGKNAKELRALGKDELADRLESQTAAEAFTATMEKLQAVLVDVVAAFSPILDIVSMIASAISKVIGMLGPFKGVLAGAAAGTAIAPGIGTVIGGILGGVSSLATMDDGIIPAGYGETIIKKGKDTIALNNNDTVVAGTNLGGSGTDMNETNQLLKMLVKQNDKKQEISPIGLYEVQ